MPYDFYEALLSSTDRALAILVHRSQGLIMYLPYTSISPAYVTRDGEMVIYAGMVVLRAWLGEPVSGETLSLRKHMSDVERATEMPSFSAPVDDMLPPDGFDADTFVPPSDLPQRIRCWLMQLSRSD